MAIQSELERYEEWRSTFRLSEEGPHTFRKLDQLRRIDNAVWGDNGWSEAEKLVKISEILSE
ncbi:hypothetical protein SEA_DEJAVU_75 [Microbacterium Phage DejaVu]|nr:hypothetical protein LUPINE_72 [Microbacterium phage Lupine]QDK03318.1 hypothetical protein SEA_ROMAN_76 [Microbacterium phage Roman]QIG58619.1 hypothetical protein SEA_HUBBS_74 [Microbacterium phage Hubbs]UVG34130.1 hypothetical protein SEA_PAVLO_73 [Microbacterium phage Pavlo]WNM66207.1 hypothetical protein SEA_DEJAVU_75 [Microbacterium Phage DejaVu]